MRLAIALGLVLAAACADSTGVKSAVSDDWPMYGHDLHHSFARKGSGINDTNVDKLTLAWTFPVSDAVSASPSVVGGVVYVGAWDGYFYALDAASGALKWKFQLDCQSTVFPVPPQCLPPGKP